MFQLITKLKIVKARLQQWHRCHRSDIKGRVAQAQDQWEKAQAHLDKNLTEEARRTEREAATFLQKLLKDEESFYKQKSRIQWLMLGDRNTAFFHRSMQHRYSRNRISNLTDGDGNVLHDQEEIGAEAVKYYKSILGSNVPSNHCRAAAGSFPSPINDELQSELSIMVSDDEIREALFSIPDGKAPGPDGFSALFFKHCWHIVGVDYTRAIKSFFISGSMPQSINAAIIALIPKVENPNSLNDYRPISCCNVIYKTISKVIANRLKHALAKVVGPSQTAFIPGRQISDAILLSQELLHRYHLPNGPPRCAMKIDLRKAFDTVQWSYIIDGLRCIGIPETMVKWIEACIIKPHFSININGTPQGWFSSSKGLRQGDPLSPYLFVLAMEGLNGMLKKATENSPFKYHWRCGRTKITHICFADDLLMFSNADAHSVSVIKSALDDFLNQSGLSINNEKSSLFLTGIDLDQKLNIQRLLGINIKSPPITYLGVPLITGRLTKRDCIPLVERILARIKLWTSATLSYAGRLQLIKATLFSMQVYWTTMFVLPISIIKTIESTLAAFLWRGSSLERHGAKVSWSQICYPIQEGGLGVKNIREWNKAATAKHLWRLLSSKHTIWANWVYQELLKGKSLWNVRAAGAISWAWRKILESRIWFRGMFRNQIGNGTSTLLWFDFWLPNGGCIFDQRQGRMLASTGLTWTATVSSIIRDGNWHFPSGQPEMQEIWNSINFLPQPHKEDTVMWQGNISGKFSISSAWEYIRKKKAQSPLADLIWFTGHVPRYAFTLWLASRERLSTMDRPHVQRIMSDNVCVLCRESPESHDHLFFECGYSRELWEVIASKVHLNIPNMNGIPLLMWAATNCNGKKRFDHLLSRHALSIATYFVWQERNRRVFQNQWKTSRTLTGEALHQLRTLLLQHTKPIPEWAMNEWNLQGAELSSSAVPNSGQEASVQPDVQVQLARPSQGDSAQHDVPAQPVVQVHPAHPTTGQGDSSQPSGYVQAQIACSMLSWAEMAVSFRSARAQPISLAE